MSLSKAATAGIVVVEFSHIICCALPMLMILSGVGTQVTFGGTLLFSHETFHGYEVALFISSAFLLLLGFGMQNLAWFKRVRISNCNGAKCAEKTLNISLAFKIAATLFVANLALYLASNHGIF